MMQYFCNNVDGGHHNQLIQEAITYLERFSLPGESNNAARMFSDLLGEIPQFNRVVTTNWDPFIERSLDVLVPTVEDRDLAFWDDAKRQVLKIHGCITRPYSIVATQNDYDECMSRNTLIFNKLKDLMATKTFIFAGYSLRDEDFQDVWGKIIGILGRFGKLAYAIDPEATPDKILEWRSKGIEIFKTTDIQFLRELRDRFEKDGVIPSRKFLNRLRSEHQRIVTIHINLRQDSDGGMASAMYQDGLLHGLSDILSATALGLKKKADFQNDLGNAARAVREAGKADNIIEVAYWSGRREVIERFCDRNDSPILAYFHPYRLIPIARLVKGPRWRKNIGLGGSEK